jgi:hypothetical protein
MPRRIDIVRKDDGTIAFKPRVLKGSTIGDRIIWRNLDPQEEHWVTGKGQPQDSWFRSAVALFVPGQTAHTTDELPLREEIDITYVSFFHPDTEGVITFAPSRGAKRASKQAAERASKRGARRRT